MSAFASILSIPASMAGATARTLGRLVYGRGRSWGVLLSRTRIDYRREVGDPATNSVVGAVVGWICRNLPQAPIKIVRQDTTEVAYEPSSTGPGAMLKLLSHPNDYYSSLLQWGATLVDWICRGNAYWLKVRNEAGRVVELWWVPEAMIEPRWPENRTDVFIGWYEYNVNGELFAIAPRDVVHFRNGIDPNNPRKGLSRLASLFREIFTDDEAANFSASLLRNLGVPGVVLSPSNTGGPTGKPDAEAVKTSFMEKFGGDKRGEPLVLTAPTDVKVLSFNPQQMELRELRRIPEERISAVLGVPAAVAGLGAGLDQNAFTSYGEARVAAYTEGAIPSQQVLAADLKTQLLDEFADLETEALDVWFDWTKVSAMQAFAALIWKQLESSATKGLITRAAFKRGTGQTVTPEDEVYVIPNNYQLVQAGGDSPRLLLQTSRPPAQDTAPADRQLPSGEVPTLAPVATAEPQEVRCSGCGKLLAEAAVPPYRITCARPTCKTVNEAEAPATTPHLTLVREIGERYEYDAEGRLAATLQVYG